MAFWDMLNKELRVVAHGVHHAAKVAKPHIEQIKEGVSGLEAVPGVVGEGAKLTDEGLSAFSLLLEKLDVMFEKYGEPPEPVPAPPSDPAPSA